MIRQCGADVVHVFKPKGFASAVYRVLRWSNIPLVLDVDDWEGWGGWNDSSSYPWLVKHYIHYDELLLLRGARVQTHASALLAARARKLRRSRVGLFRVPNGVSRELLDRMPPPEEINEFRQRFASRKKVVLYTGHFEAADDPTLFWRTIEPIVEMPEAQAWIVGDGPHLQLVRERFRRLGTDAVRFFGALDYENYLLAVNAADIALFPYPDNLVYRAKCSARVIDYMAASKPIVSTFVGANREYVRNGITGILAKANDVRGLRDALHKLVFDDELCRQLGTAGRQLLEEHFAWSGALVQNCERAYLSALAQNRNSQYKTAF
jgi:glycosyltransferase involved in cell wall biosynthesis